MKGDTYYLVLLSMFLIGEYFRVKYGINENILFVGLILYVIYDFYFVDFNDCD